MTSETVEVPFVTIGNRRALTDEQLMSNVWLMHFLVRFKHRFERDARRQCWLLIEGDDE